MIRVWSNNDRMEYIDFATGVKWSSAYNSLNEAISFKILDEKGDLVGQVFTKDVFAIEKR